MKADWIALLLKNGWEVECESPFEIRNVKSESFATGEAAQLVLTTLQMEDNRKGRNRFYSVFSDAVIEARGKTDAYERLANYFQELAEGLKPEKPFTSGKIVLNLLPTANDR